MKTLEIKDLNGATVTISQYVNNLVWVNSTDCDVLIDKKIAISIVKLLTENFSI